jgi:hypothetical protein
MFDISKIMGAGGGGGGNPMAAMGMMQGMAGKMGGLGGLGGTQMPGMGPPQGGAQQPDPRMQNATMEQIMDPGGPLAYRFGGMGGLNPAQQAIMENKQGSAPTPGTGMNMNALAPFFMAQQGQQGGAMRGPFRGM